MDKIVALREAIFDAGVDGFLIPMDDAFGSEYVPPHDRRLEWLTGFTGSAGFAVVTKNKVAFFTDGRYTLQAASQVDKGFERYDSTQVKLADWLAEHAQGQVIGFDPWLHSLDAIDLLDEAAELQAVENLVDVIWRDKPVAPSEPIFAHGLEFAGEASADKQKRVWAEVSDDVGALLVASPENICWLLNIRGCDAQHTPLALCYALLRRGEQPIVYIDPKKVPDDLGVDVEFVDIAEIESSLLSFNGAVQLDPSVTSVGLCMALGDEEFVEEDDPIFALKAVKNETEIAGMRAAHVRDGKAVSAFIDWVKDAVKAGEVTELDVADKLLELRSAQEHFHGLSFDTIAGYAEHGAIIHYKATEESAKVLKPEGLLLVDSGTQYRDGTTDITRTIALGEVSEEQRRMYTLVLKGHIAIAMARFPVGTTGAQLDALARQYLWAEGLDYAHGTGHGVGSFLSVHEGPQGISKRARNVALQPGMILSNEPGYYKEGAYGIRIENLVLVEERGAGWLGFENLTLAPLEDALIDASLLSDAERQWLEDYE